MFALGVLTDEISPDLERALNVMEELGLKYAELQTVWDKYIGRLSEGEVERIGRMVADRGMKVSCISPHCFFNVPLRADPDDKCYWGSYSEHLEDLKRCVHIAKELGTNLVRTFAFRIQMLLDPPVLGDWWSLLLDKFKEPLKIAEQAGVTLVVETAFLTNTADCYLARKLIDDLGSKSMKVLWDVANGLFHGEKPYPEGYEHIKNRIGHIHIKDGVPNRSRFAFHFCAPGKGQVKTFPEILKALQRDGYGGVLSFECEYIPEGGTKEDALRMSVTALRDILNGL